MMEICHGFFISTKYVWNTPMLVQLFEFNKQLLAPAFLVISESENRRFCFMGVGGGKLGIKYLSISVIFKT
jgi:hypothetical protein